MMDKDPLRIEWIDLTGEAKERRDHIKELGQPLYKLINDFDDHASDPRCMAIARTKLEEAVMWAVKGVTVTQGDLK